jgi:nascent polypeptide-associated complex subunit alpha
MKLNPKQIEKAMKRMGIQAQEIDAEEVIIKTAEKTIIITEPQVSRVNMMGQDTFQVSGEITEKETAKFSEEDIKTVIDQTGASEDDVRKALEETQGDLAESILRLKKDED